MAYAALETETHARVRAYSTDDFGLTVSGEVGLGDLLSAFTEAVRAKNQSGWIIGDTYLAAEDSGLAEAFSQALDPTIISLRTVQNYASTCRVFIRDWRRVPLSLSHYQACAALASQQPTEALELLQSAYDGGLSREWVRQEAAKRTGRGSEPLEVLLTWNPVQQVFVPDQHLDLPSGATRTLRFNRS